MAIELFNRRTPIRWDPFWSLRGLQDEMNRLFADLSGEDTGTGVAKLTPAVDLVDTKDDVIVKVELPGIKKEDVDITLSDGLLTIKGEKKVENEEKEGSRYYFERRYGSFTRAIALPAKVKPDKIKAKFTDGVLEVKLPKAEEEKTREIKIALN
ncbi:MAG: Hsp20/alpha crystallin family protein [bacterium]